MNPEIERLRADSRKYKEEFATLSTKEQDKLRELHWLGLSDLIKEEVFLMAEQQANFGVPRPRKRWNGTTNRNSRSARIDAFLADVLKVCKTHGLSISHEDTHGAFNIEPFREDLAEWFMAAHDYTGDK